MTTEQELLFKAYFYSGIGFSTYSYGSIVSILYLDENELILQAPDDRLWSGNDTKKVKLQPLFFEVKKAKHNGLDTQRVIQQLDTTQRNAAIKIQELSRQITSYQEHRYISAAQKKKFITGFKKGIAVYEHVIKECDRSRKFMASRK
jgi:hypothetical protein